MNDTKSHVECLNVACLLVFMGIFHFLVLNADLSWDVLSL